jgi:TRAP-type mannitol/chloroaromatic compound transport system permease small subunit
MAVLDRHWFAPASVRELALVRILVFGSQTAVFLWYWGGRPRSVAEQLFLATAGAPLYQPLPILQVLLAPFGQLSAEPPSATFLRRAFAVAVIAGVLATIGLFARASMIAAALANAMVVAHHYSYQEFHRSDSLMIIALGVIALGPSADAWSVDAAIRKWRRGESAPRTAVLARWPLRLMQWLLALTYLSAAISKMQVGGLEWFNGHTMTYYYAWVAIFSGGERAAYMATLSPKLHVLPSVFACTFEATFFMAILAPRLVWLFILTGAAMYLGVFATMGIKFFQTIVLYVVFVESLRRYAPRPLGARRIGEAAS